MYVNPADQHLLGILSNLFILYLFSQSSIRFKSESCKKIKIKASKRTRPLREWGKYTFNKGVVRGSYK